MRFTCYRTIVTKVFDDVLDDHASILNLLTEIKQKELTCALQVQGDKLHEQVRILGVDEASLTWRAFNSDASLKKTSKISDIQLLSLHTDDELLIKLKPHPGRWSILDASGK